MSGTGMQKFVLMLMVMGSGVSMIVRSSQDLLHTALKNGDGIAEKLAHEIGERFINRAYSVQLSDDMKGPWNGRDGPLKFRTTTINVALLYKRENVAMILIDRGANLLSTDQYGNTPLHIAASKGLNSAVNKILDKVKMLKPKVIDIKNSAGETPLHMAIRYNQDLIVKSLLDRGADPMIADKYGNTPLHLAVKNSLSGQSIIHIIDAAKPKTVDILDQNGTTEPSVCLSDNNLYSVNGSPDAHHGATSEIINLRNDFGETALLLALVGNSFRTFRILLDKGADPSISDKRGNTPFHIKMPPALTDEIILPWIKTMNVNHRNNKGSTLLHKAVKFERGVVAKDLLDRGADPSITDNNGNTPFHIALPSKLTDEVILSSIRHMNVNHRNKNGATLLHTAIKSQREFLVKDLLDRGANPIIANHQGLTALHLAIVHGLSQEIIIHIIKAGRPKPSHILIQNGMTERLYRNIADRLMELHLNSDLVSEVFERTCDDIVNLQTQMGRTALFEAAHAGSVGIAQILLENGADPTIMDKSHILPLQGKYMTEETSMSMIQNVDVNHRYIDGSTILHLAIGLRWKAAIKYLLDKGASPTIADNSGNTALHRAIFSDVDKRILVQILDAARPKPVESGCLNGEVNHDDRQIGACEGINLRNHQGETALLLAFRYSRHVAAQVLFERGADPNLSDSYGKTLLCFNMPSFLTDEFVISNIKNMDVNYRYSDGNTLLHKAVMNNREKVIKDLLDRGANPMLRDHFKCTVLHLAVEHNLSEQIVIDIIEATASPRVWQDNMTGQLGLLGGFLCRCGLKLQDIFCGPWEQILLNMRNWDGKTALHFAVSKQRVNLVRVFLERGACRTIKSYGETALDLAIKEKTANSTPIADTIVELLQS